MMESQSPHDTEVRPLGEDLRHYALLIWNWIWLILLAALLGAGAAYYVSSRTTPVYQASTTVLVDQAANDGSREYQSILMSERLTQTYAELLTKQPVLEAVREKLSLPGASRGLREMITVQPVRDTQLIEVMVENENPELAAMIANTLVEEFIEQNDARQTSRYAASKASLETQLERMDQKITETNAALEALGEGPEYEDERNRLELTLSQYQNTYTSLLQSYEEVRTQEAQSISNLVQVEPAAAPRSPVRPRTTTNTALVGVVGAMLAVGGIFLIEALDNSVKNPDQIEAAFGLSVLGMIPKHIQEEGVPIAVGHPRHPSVEAFRALRTNLKYASVDRKIQKIMITSADPGIGKTGLATNLAVVFAQGGSKVMLIDADLRKPKVHHRFGLENRTGLSRLFMRDAAQKTGVVTQKLDIANLSVLTTGPLPPNPSEVLGSDKMGEIIKFYSERLDYIIVDSPPIMAVTDAVVMSRLMDGVLLVAKPGETKLGALDQSISQLRRVNAKLLGVVLNEIPQNGHRYYYRGYQYYTYQGYYEEEES